MKKLIGLLVIFFIANTGQVLAQTLDFPKSVAGEIVSIETKDFTADDTQTVLKNLETIIADFTKYDDLLVTSGQLTATEKFANLAKNYEAATDSTVKKTLAAKILARIAKYFEFEGTQKIIKGIASGTLSYGLLYKDKIYSFDCDGFTFLYFEMLERAFTKAPPVVLLTCVGWGAYKGHVMLRWYYGSNATDYIEWNPRTNQETFHSWYPGVCREIDPFKDKNKLDAVGYINRAGANHELGNEADALSNYSTAILLDGYASYYADRGTTETTLKMYTEALADFNTAIDNNTKAGNHEVAGYYAGRGSVEAPMGKLSEAKKDLDKAIVLGPNVAEYYAGRGMVENLLKLYTDARKDLDQAILLDKNNADYYNDRIESDIGLLSYADIVKDCTTAINLYGLQTTKTSEQKTNLAWNYFNLGLAQTSLNKDVEAITAFSKAIELAPDNVEAYYYLAVVEDRNKAYTASLEHYNKAIELYNEEIKLSPENAAVHNHHRISACASRAYINYQFKKYSEAKADYTTVIDAINDKSITSFSSQDLANYYYSRGNAESFLTNTEETANAIKDYDASIALSEALYKAEILVTPNSKNAMEIVSNLVDGYNNLGVLEERLAEYDSALTSLNKAIDLNKNQGAKTLDLYATRAIIYTSSKKYGDATKDYTLIINAINRTITATTNVANKKGLYAMLAMYYTYRSYTKGLDKDATGSAEDSAAAATVQDSAK